MFGERNMIRAGYRWDVIASFPCNAGGVRVAIRKTRRGAERFSERFGKLNRIDTHIRLSCGGSTPPPARSRTTASRPGRRSGC